MNHQIIDNQSQLEDVCDSLADSDWITIDTEFMRERTYYPQLCLVQAGTDQGAWCFDALAPVDTGKLLNLVCENASVRVMHAARQDMEIFFNLNDTFTSPLFDTQVAAALIGYDAQIGYAGLIKQLLDIELEKGYQRANWARRPLPPAQVEYALDDVRYLATAYPLLLERLQELGRLDWAREDCDRLLNRDLYIVNPEAAYGRIGQVRALPAQEQSIVRELANWREQLAQKSDRPRSWIGNDNTLVYIAQVKPDTAAKLKKVKGLSPQLIEQECDAILSAIARGIDNGSDKLMSHPSPLSDSEQKLYKQLKQKLDHCARSLAIDTPVLGTRKDLEMLLRGNENSLLLSGWRRSIIGDELLAMC